MKKKQYIIPIQHVLVMEPEADIVQGSPKLSDEDAEEEYGEDTKQENTVWDDVWNRTTQYGK